MRRHFYELAAAGPEPLASEALERIARLYLIEDDIRGRNADERRAARQKEAVRSSKPPNSAMSIRLPT